MALADLVNCCLDALGRGVRRQCLERGGQLSQRLPFLFRRWAVAFPRPHEVAVVVYGVPRQLVCLVCAAEDADPWGYNPIFSGDQIVGMTSSGGYGHRTGKSIALGYVIPDLAVPGTRLEVEVLGQKLAAEVVAMPLYDPKNEKMKA